MWDYDPPAAPNLIDITVDGQRIKAVAQVTKQAFTYVFDRASGKPVWPIEERPVPASTVPGERASPTQPFPTKPAPFDLQGLRDEDLIDLTPQIHKEAMEIATAFDRGALFTPPSLRGTIQNPGKVGGASWAGAAIDPETGTLYVGTQRLPSLSTIFKPEPVEFLLRSYRRRPVPAGAARAAIAQAAVRQHRRHRPEQWRASLAHPGRA